MSAKGGITHLIYNKRPIVSTARLQTPYKNTTGYCLELFYFKPAKESMLIVSVLGENMEENTLLLIKQEAKYWRRQFVKLPNGLHQIIIEGKIDSGETAQSIALDDVNLMLCEEFSE